MQQEQGRNNERANITMTSRGTDGHVPVIGKPCLFKIGRAQEKRMQGQVKKNTIFRYLTPYERESDWK